MTFPLPLDWSWAVLWLLVFLTFSVGGVLAVSALLVRLPETYFFDGRSRGFWKDSHPVLCWMGLIVKNIAGAVFVALGLALSMPGVPGPGILTILLGITLMDFPGKRRLERWLIGRPRIFAAVNRLRRRYGRPPFILEAPVAQRRD